MAAVARGRTAEDKVVLQRTMRLESEFAEDRVIGLHRFNGLDHAFDNVPQKLDERQLAFGLIDFAAEEGRATAVFANVVDQLECIERRPALPPSTPTTRCGS